MSEPFDFQSLVPAAPKLLTGPQQIARDAAHSASIIAEILLGLAYADISGGRSICGSSIGWLANRLSEAVDRIEPGIVT